MDYIRLFFEKNGLLIVSFLEILLLKVAVFFLFVLVAEAVSRILKNKDYKSFDIGWSFKDVIQIFIIFTGFQALTVFIKGDIEGANIENLAVFWSIIEYLFLLVLVLYFVFFVYDCGPRSIGLISTDLKKDLRSAGAAFVYLLLTAAVVNIIYSYEILTPASKIIRHVSFKEFFSGGAFVYLKYLLIFAIAPAVEEIFYRGFIYPVVRNKTGPFLGMILISLFFTTIHFEPNFFILVFLLSCMTCYLYEKTRSLAAPVLIHAAYNIFVQLGLFHY